MQKEYIAIIDSGIGGISVLKNLVTVLPNENFIYVSDDKNAPYGNKSNRKLFSVFIDSFSFLLNYNLKCIVLACNTLSLTIKKQIEDFFSIKTYGVFPPVEKCQVNGKKTILLSTLNTAVKYKDYKNLTVIGFYYLAEDIETCNGHFEKIDLDYHLKNSYINTTFSQTKIPFGDLIIGCTHYNFIKNKIFAYFDHQEMVSGDVLTTNSIAKELKSQKLFENNYQNEILFLGANAEKNYNIFNKVVKNASFYVKKL